LPETANFLRQVEYKRVLEGVYPLAKLSRLSEQMLNATGNVAAKLEFGNSVGFACLKGSVSARVLLECQRCLQPVKFELSGQFKLALISNEDEQDLLPEEFEPYLLEGDEQSIIDLVEDELLLCLPMVSVHEEACSDYMLTKNEQVKQVIEKEKEAAHPFAALKSLKSR
jgi:uncharacterized protein